MPTTLIIVAAVAILIILLATASYKVCPADRVMVITGPGGRRFVSGGSAFIIPLHHARGLALPRSGAVAPENRHVDSDEGRNPHRRERRRQLPNRIRDLDILPRMNAGDSRILRFGFLFDTTKQERRGR